MAAGGQKNQLRASRKPVLAIHPPQKLQPVETVDLGGHRHDDVTPTGSGAFSPAPILKERSVESDSSSAGTWFRAVGGGVVMEKL